jgi:hypothetical protein
MARLSAMQRRQEIREYLEATGPLHLNKSEMARRYHVTDKVIAHDIELLMKSCEPQDSRLLLKKMDQCFSAALGGTIKALQGATDTRSLVDAAKALSAVTSDYLRSLSALGYNIGNGPGDVFTVESLRELVLKRAESEQRSIVSILSEILDIKIKFTARDFKEFLNSEPKIQTSKADPYKQVWPVKTKPVEVKVDPPRAEHEEEPVLIPLTPEEEAELKQEQQDNEEEDSQ